MPELTHDEKVALFRATADDYEAHKRFAASRAEVILPLINVQSTVRSIYKVETNGAATTFDIPHDDVECVWNMPNIGAIPTVQLEGKQLQVNFFGIDGGVDYQIDVARDGRIQVAEQATNLLKNKVIMQEEIAGWGLIKNHSAVLPDNQKVQAYLANGSVATPGQGIFNLWTLSEVITRADEIGVGGRRVTDIFLSPRRFNDLRLQIGQGLLVPEGIKMQLWGESGNWAAGGGNDAQRELGGLRIHKVYNRLLVPDNKAYAFTQKDGYFYGVMPIKEAWNTQDNPVSIMEWKRGVIGRARFGMGILDDKGLVEITF